MAGSAIRTGIITPWNTRGEGNKEKAMAKKVTKKKVVKKVAKKKTAPFSYKTVKKLILERKKRHQRILDQA